jgi:hypothetical protein
MLVLAYPRPGMHICAAPAPRSLLPGNHDAGSNNMYRHLHGLPDQHHLGEKPWRELSSALTRGAQCQRCHLKWVNCPKSSCSLFADGAGA